MAADKDEQKSDETRISDNKLEGKDHPASDSDDAVSGEKNNNMSNMCNKTVTKNNKNSLKAPEERCEREQATIATISGPCPTLKSSSSHSASESNLALVLIGIVLMHFACHSLRVFLSGVAVYLLHDTVYCIQTVGGYVPPLWTMCAESVSSLLVMVNFSGNFLIYCSILRPFKAALRRLVFEKRASKWWTCGPLRSQEDEAESRRSQQPPTNEVAKAYRSYEDRDPGAKSESRASVGSSLTEEKKVKMKACAMERDRVSLLVQGSSYRRVTGLTGDGRDGVIVMEDTSVMSVACAQNVEMV